MPSSVSCTDALSGIAKCEAPTTLDTSTLGTRAFTATAADLADNTAQKTVSYRIGGKDDCKDDGWRLFLVPTFRNQGECVSSFVP